MFLSTTALSSGTFETEIFFSPETKKKKFFFSVSPCFHVKLKNDEMLNFLIFSKNISDNQLKYLRHVEQCTRENCVREARRKVSGKLKKTNELKNPTE